MAIFDEMFSLNSHSRSDNDNMVLKIEYKAWCVESRDIGYVPDLDWHCLGAIERLACSTFLGVRPARLQRHFGRSRSVGHFLASVDTGKK